MICDFNYHKTAEGRMKVGGQTCAEHTHISETTGGPKSKPLPNCQKSY